MDKRKYKISGMSCAACVARVEKSVKALEGIESCDVNLLLGSMQIEGDTPDGDIISAVESAGYGITPEDGKNTKSDPSPDENKRTKGSEIRKMISRFIPSGILLIILMYISMAHTMWNAPLPSFLSENPLAIAITQMLISAVIIVINKHFYLNGIRGIVHLAPNMDTLVSLGSFASFVYSVAVLFMMSADYVSGNLSEAHARLHGLYFESSAMILVLIGIGKLLEAVAKGKTTSAIESLIDLTPKTATVIRDGKETVIAARDVLRGDVFILKRGDRVPADGVIAEGEVSIDESALTGESIPRDLSVGARVLGGSAVVSGYAKVSAERVGDETSIAEVIRMVKEASGSKAPVAKAADKVAGVFVPAVMLIALVTFAIWMISGADVGYAIARGVSVLVISCPCALGLATPVAVMVGSGVGARLGILFKNAAALEASGKIKVIAFDKTGTVTLGTPTVTDVIPLAIEEREIIKIASSLEVKNEHPLARAIVRYAEEKNIMPADISGYTAEVGGVCGEVYGEKYYIGNPKYIISRTGISEGNECLTHRDKLSESGKTVLILAKLGTPLAVIALADEIRPDSESAVEAISKLGIKTVMITGDNAKSASYVASRVGISEVFSEVLPADKADIIKKLKSEGTVAMVGDGINDSVALTEADVGIAIGAGADVAIDSADVVLSGSDLTSVLNSVRLGRNTLRNIYENLFWAFFYNIIGIPLAAGAFIPLFGWELEPMFGAMAMSISSFIVVMNSLRLNLFKKTEKHQEMQTKLDNIKEKTEMKVTIKIEGMMCPHCSGRVKEALLAHPSVADADVSHERGDAIVTLRSEVATDELNSIVTNAGYKVI